MLRFTLLRLVLPALVVLCFGAMVVAQEAPRVDLDVTFLRKVPERAFDAAPRPPRRFRRRSRAPRRARFVVWRAYVRNRGTLASGRYRYRWLVDGRVVKEGTARSIDPNGEGRVALLLRQRSPARIRLEVDPNQAIGEVSEGNNAREVLSNALSVGLWVERSFRDYFDRHQHEYQATFGIDDGANSFEDWAQRQIARWNRMLEEAVFPSAPNGGLDRIRLQKVVVVDDGALPLSGGVPTNHPDLSDKTVDMQWGFPGPVDTNFHDRLRGDSAFNVEPSLIHELQHARFLVDAYGMNIHGHQIEVRDDAGERIFPENFNMVRPVSVRGLMNGTTLEFSEWSVAWLNEYAYQRPLPGWGNTNAHLGVWTYMKTKGIRHPRENVLELLDKDGQPVVGARVVAYQAQRRESGDMYDKLIDDEPDLVTQTDGLGRVSLGRNPFGLSTVDVNGADYVAGVVFYRVQHAGREHHVWLDLPQVHVAWFRGDQDVAVHTRTLD